MAAVRDLALNKQEADASCESGRSYVYLPFYSTHAPMKNKLDIVSACMASACLVVGLYLLQQKTSLNELMLNILMLIPVLILSFIFSLALLAVSVLIRHEHSGLLILRLVLTVGPVAGVVSVIFFNTDQFLQELVAVLGVFLGLQITKKTRCKQ